MTEILHTQHGLLPLTARSLACWGPNWVGPACEKTRERAVVHRPRLQHEEVLQMGAPPPAARAAPTAPAAPPYMML
jgi:hypothetical protein